MLKSVISGEITPLAALYPPPLPYKKMLYSTVVAGGDMLMPAAFAPLSIVSV